MPIFGKCSTGLQDGKRYLHKKEPHDEGGALAVTNLAVMDTKNQKFVRMYYQDLGYPPVGLHDVEERLLADTVLLLEELVLGVGAGNVAPDHLRKQNYLTIEMFLWQCGLRTVGQSITVAETGIDT